MARPARSAFSLGRLAVVLPTLSVALFAAGCRGCGGAGGAGGGAGRGQSAVQAAPSDFQKIATTFSVSCGAPGKKISPYIYGIGFDITGYSDWKDPRQWDMKPSGRRLGGNQASRYNWEHGTAFNHGNDWIFANNGYTEPTDPFWQTFMKGNADHGAMSAVEIPLLGWVAKDTTSVSFPIAKYGRQKAMDEGRGGGNGLSPDGKELPPGPPSVTSQVSTPEWQAKWVKKIREYAQQIKSPGPRVYMLDNEPALWNSTHRDVHPNPTTYDELMQLTKAYAAVVREADPEGKIAGPAAFGWPEYLYSAKDAKEGFHLKPDRRAHEDMEHLAWYLRELKRHEDKTGKRLLDLLDVHFYPQGDGIGLGLEGNTDAKTSEVRVRSVRGLWDPTYVDESWIKEPVKLIPRLRAWIDQYYPGTGIQIGEWNFGAEKDMSSGLATAETLGRFAEGGVDQAYYWPFPRPDTAAYWAFRAFRNYDGEGGRFEDELLATAAVEKTSLWASRDDAKKKIVLVLLNFSLAKTHDTGIALEGCGAVDKVRGFTYVGGPGKKLDAMPVTPGANGVGGKFPPYSISVVEVSLK